LWLYVNCLHVCVTGTSTTPTTFTTESQTTGTFFHQYGTFRHKVSQLCDLHESFIQFRLLPNKRNLADTVLYWNYFDCLLQLERKLSNVYMFMCTCLRNRDYNYSNDVYDGVADYMYFFHYFGTFRPIISRLRELNE